MLNDVELGNLRKAIRLARTARERGNHPFGAILVGAKGDVLAEAQNTVVTERDCTGHAELNLARTAAQQYDPETLARSTLFSSTEPCAMCAGAIFWSGIGRVVYALPEEALYQLTGSHRANDAMRLPCREVFARCGRPIEVVGPGLEAEAADVHLGFWRPGPEDT